MVDNYDRLIDLYPSPNTDQAAPISADDLRKLLEAATPGPWVWRRLDLPDEPYWGNLISGDNVVLDLPSFYSLSDAGLIALAPQLAAEVLARRADLAAPSAPAEVEGLVITDEMVEDGLANYSEGGCCGLGNDERREVVRAILEAAIPTALTALQAEIERLGDLFDDLCYFTTPEQRREYLSARAEKAEAVADQLADALHHMVNASLHPDQFADEALAAYAKLKGEA